MKYIIYALVDPNTKLVRYIGKSSSGLTRPKQHLKPYSYNKTFHVSYWVKSLIILGMEPEIHVLQVLSDSNCLKITEQWWIAYGRCLGWPLTNLTDGGEGNLGWHPSIETRQAIGLANKNRIWTEESRRRSGEASARRTPEGIRKNVEAMRSPEAKAKKSASLKGKPKSKEHKAKLAVNLAKARSAQKQKRLDRLNSQ